MEVENQGQQKRTQFVSPDPEFASRMHASFSRQGFLRHLGVRIVDLEAGCCKMELPFRDELSQQHGYFAGGVVATLADVAAGYAAFSLAERDASMVTVEFKVNFIAPAAGERLIACGEVLKPGKSLTVCRSEVSCVKNGRETPCATALATFIALPGRPEKHDRTAQIDTDAPRSEEQSRLHSSSIRVDLCDLWAL